LTKEQKNTSCEKHSFEEKKIGYQTTKVDEWDKKAKNKHKNIPV
jgi:hypothetical protein